MSRILFCIWLGYVCAVSPAVAQQAPPRVSEEGRVAGQPPPAQPAPEQSGSQGTSIRDTLSAVQGRLEIIDDNHLRSVGRVEMPLPGQQGYRLFADVVDIYLDTETLVADGNVAFTTMEGRVTAERVEFNMRDGTATFYNAHGLMRLPEANRAEFGNQDPDVYFFGDIIEKRGPRQYVITDGGFSTCLQPTPRWAIGSSKITIDVGDYAFARNMVLRVKGVPLFYLPAVYYPMQDDGRATGFLMPTYGSSNILGGSISNAFFWAIGRSHDATFYHDWFTRTGTGAGAEYRYVSGANSSGTFRLYRLNQNQTQFDEENRTLPAETSFQVNAAVNQELPLGLRGQANVEYFSSVATQQIYEQNPYERSNSVRRISGGVTGNYGRLALGGYYTRSEQFSDQRNSTVYGSTPRATASIAPSRLFGSPAYASMNTEYLFQPNQRRVDGIVIPPDQSLGRYDLAPELRVPLSQLTYLSVTTTAEYRLTHFSKSLDASGNLVTSPVTRNYMSLETNIVGPTLSKVWDTPESGFSDRRKHIIEPSFNVEYITDISNEGRVPITDATIAAVGGAAKFTYGVTNRLIARTRAAEGARGTTREFLTVGVKQSYYTNPETSRHDAEYVSYSLRPLPVDLSPIAFTARVSPIPNVDADAKAEYDVTGNGLQVLSAGGAFNSARASANLTYSRQRATPDADVNSYLSAATSWRLRQGRMSALYGLSWDIGRGYVVSHSLGGAYLAQCCGLRADYTIYNFPPDSPSPFAHDNRLNFAFILAGVGTFSNFFGLFGQP